MTTQSPRGEWEASEELEPVLRNLEECLSDYLYEDSQDIARAVANPPPVKGEEVSGDELLARIRYRALVEQGAFFKAIGRVNWRVVPRSPSLPRTLIQELSLIGEVLDKFLKAVEAQILKSPFLKEFLGFPPGEKEELLLRAQENEPLGMLRVDVVLEDGRVPKVLEIQVVMGGLGITQALRTAYGPHPLLCGIASGYEEALDWASRGASLPRVVAILGAKRSHYRHEHLCLARHISSWRMMVAPVSLLGEGERFLELNGVEIGIIQRLFRAPAALNTLYGEKVLKALIEGKVVLINPWKDFLEDKRLLALVHDQRAKETLGKRLNDEDWTKLREIIPGTWKLDSPKLAQLVGLSRGSRAFYLKRGRSWECKGLFHGRKLNPRQWEAALRRAKAEGDWIIQEEVRSVARPFTYWDPASGVLKTMMGYTRICPYYFRSRDGSLRLADVLLTARETSSRIHGATDAVMAVVGDETTST